MTQQDLILGFLMTGERLTPATALRSFGCMRLAARIYDLRRQGYAIEERIIEVPTRTGTARVSEYWIPGRQGVLFESKPDFKWE